MAYTQVTISAGHGARIEGAVGNGYKEHVEATKIMVAVTKYLKQLGVTVNTYEDTTSTSQNANLKSIVNYHNKTVRQLDVSIHLNSSANTLATGTEVLSYDSRMITLADAVSKNIANALGIKNRGVKYNKGLYFLSNTRKPAILIEIAFISNASDMKAYKENFDSMCKGIACAIAGKTFTVTKPTVETKPPVIEEAGAIYRLYSGTFKTKKSAEAFMANLNTLVKVVYLKKEDTAKWRVVTGTFKTLASTLAMIDIVKDKFDVNMNYKKE